MTERTFVIIKPDAVQRGLVGEINKRIERSGLKLVALKMAWATPEQLAEHYDKDSAWYQDKGAKRKKLLIEAKASIDESRPPIEFGKDIINGIKRFMMTTPLPMMVWEGNEAVAVVRKLVGGTEPKSSDVGTIRGDYQHDSYSLSDVEQPAIRNLIHCSDHPSEVEREIPIWFKPEELHDYRHINEAILKDVNLDGSPE
jgi:nucleoside-diphosphate kinase